MSKGICTVCGLDIETFNANRPRGRAATRLVGHHGDGYDCEPWPVCASCNAILRGSIFHCGWVSRLQSRQIVASNISSQLRHRIASGEVVEAPAGRPAPPLFMPAYQDRLDLVGGQAGRVKYVESWPPVPPPELPPPPAESDGPARWVGWFVEGGRVIWLDQYLQLHDPATDPPTNPYMPVPPRPADPPELPARREVNSLVQNLHEPENK